MKGAMWHVTLLIRRVESRRGGDIVDVKQPHAATQYKQTATLRIHNLKDGTGRDDVDVKQQPHINALRTFYVHIYTNICTYSKCYKTM